jgi:hypothetical protein
MDLTERKSQVTVSRQSQGSFSNYFVKIQLLSVFSWNDTVDTYKVGRIGLH